MKQWIALVELPATARRVLALTNDRRRSESSGWYVRASSDRGRSLSTRSAIVISEGLVGNSWMVGLSKIAQRVGGTRRARAPN